MRKYLGQKGTIPPVAIIIVAALLIGSALYFGFNKSQTNSVVTPSPTTQQKTASPSANAQASTKASPSKAPSASQKSTPTPTPTPTSKPQSSYDIQMSCMQIYNGYPTNRSKFKVDAKVYNVTENGIWTTLTDQKNSQTIIFQGAQYNNPLVFPILLNYEFSYEVHGIRGSDIPISLIGEADRKYTVKLYNAPYTSEIPQLNSSNLLYEKTLSADCSY